MPAKQRLKIKQLYSLPNGLHCDGDGLYLNVNGEARSWVFRYRMDGKERKAGLGSLRFVTLAQARAKVFQMKQEMANGITPQDLKRQTTQLIVTETGSRYFKNHFQEAIENTKRVKGWTSVRTSMRWYKVIERYALPVIGNMDISVIKRDHILQILLPLWEGNAKTGEPAKVETGAKLQGYLHGVFEYFITRGWCGENPARWKTGLNQFLPSHKQYPTKHHPALDWREVSPVVKTLMSGNLTQYNDKNMRMATLFGILTATRIQEFVLAQWDEVDFATKTWSVPVERRKDKKDYPHRVPLSKQAVALLKDLQKGCKGKYIFSSPDGRGHISKEAPIRYLRMAADDDGLSMHGCRSTFRDWCADHEVKKEVAEKALSHETGNEVELAYQHSDLLDLRCPVMQAWADHCFSEVK